MRRLVLGIVGLVLAGCATAAEQEVSRLREVQAATDPAIDACDQRLEQSAPYQALKSRLGPTSGTIPLALKASPDKASPAEVQQIFALHQEYMTPCRKLKLEALAQMHPALVGVIAEYYAKTDAALVQLTNRQITWGQYMTQKDAINVEANARYDAAAAEIRKDLNRSHALEMARRQQAANALAQFAYQQQVLQQRQQMIDAANRPRLTTCQYYGATLNCTTN